jgi:hypothetical protein
MNYHKESYHDVKSCFKIGILRQLVTSYVVCIFNIVAREEGFLGLIAEGEAFIRNLTGKLQKKLECEAIGI